MNELHLCFFRQRPRVPVWYERRQRALEEILYKMLAAVHRFTNLQPKILTEMKTGFTPGADYRYGDYGPGVGRGSPMRSPPV